MFVVIKYGNIIVEPIRKMLIKPKLLFICLLALTLLPISAYAAPAQRGTVRADSTVINVVAQPVLSNMTTAYNTLVEMTPTQDLTGQDLGGFTLTTASNSLATVINGANVYLEAGSSATLDTAPIKRYSHIKYHYRWDLERPIGTNTTDQETITPIPEPATMCLLGLGALSVIRRKLSLCQWIENE